VLEDVRTVSKTAAKGRYRQIRKAAEESVWNAQPDPVRIHVPPPLGRFVDTYMTFYKANHRPSSVARVERHLRTLILSSFRSMRLDHISVQAVEAFKADVQSCGYATWTINKAVAHLKAMLNRAVLWGEIPHNPMRGVKSLTPPERLRVLTEDEQSQLLAACNVRVRPVVMAALQTGFRLMELASLTWRDIDFSHRVISVQGTLSKTGKCHAIPMTGTLYALLAPAAGPPDAPIFGYAYSSIGSLFGRAVKRAGIAPIRFHDLRHTFAPHGSLWLVWTSSSSKSC
jgi:integrase